MSPQKKQRLDKDELRIQKKNRRKVIRTVFEVLLVGAIVALVVKSLFFAPRYTPVTADAAYVQPGDGADGEGSHFIAISYNGLTKSEGLDSAIVSQNAFEEQMAALHASGYVAITQQDIIDYYLYHTPLPEKALFLIFEDGILNTATLAQTSLERYNYIATACTYAANLSDVNSKFLTTANMKKLLANSFWEMGSNGYRLSYINIFDRYQNYFGHLTTNEYVMINQFLRRDYNHYLMDFLRDEDRLRQETVTEMEQRIEYDYEQMEQIYSGELGYVPSLYILMHSNTGAFGNDPLVSAKNRELLTALYAMNFNRQGSCLNTLDSSIYDLTRLQSRSYFSTNHLLMRIWDDTGDDVAFVTGDREEAAKWYVDEGVAEYRGNEIILTTNPYDEGQMTLKETLLSDLDMTVTLQGNKVGIQSIYLRTDRNREGGVQVSLENNELVVRDLTAGGEELFRLDLFTFDGGPFVSEQEDELNGLIELNKAIIAYDEDEERVALAQAELARLEGVTAISLEEGGTPYIPELDIAERDSRVLRIRLVGSRLSLWLDERQVAERLPVTASGRGSVAFGAGVWKDTERFSQTNLHDDVYDAVFIDPIITDVDDPGIAYYKYRLDDVGSVGKTLKNAFDAVMGFFLDNF